MSRCFSIPRNNPYTIKNEYRLIQPSESHKVQLKWVGNTSLMSCTNHPKPKKGRTVKICSLLPSGTEIVYALGLGEHLVGVSDLCDYPPEARRKPVISRSRIDTAVLSSVEVEAKMRSLLERGESPFYIDAAALRANPPDLVLTQDTCAICDAVA